MLLGNLQRKTGPYIAAISMLLFIAPILQAASTYHVIYAFTGNPDGVGPYSGLVRDTSGNLYGTTIVGGTNHWGTVFQLKPGPGGEWTEKLLHSFQHGGSDGEQPTGTPAIDGSGNLYGTTELSGKDHHGTAFEMSHGPSGWQFNVLYSFCSQPDCADGGSMVGGLVLDSAGNLYGVSNVVFELSPGSNGWTDNALYAFCSKPGCIDGQGSFGSLLLDGKGNIFGTTGSGGKHKAGTVFKLKHMPDGSWTEHVLHHFGASQDGQIPGWEQLAADGSGNLYGTTEQGGSHGCGEVACGTVFRLTHQPDGHWKETILHNFKPGQGGYSPYAGVVIDQAGNLYGTTGYGGTNCDCGVIYKLSPNPDGTWAYRVLHRFAGSDGANPNAALIFDDQGNLYGTTIGGGGGFGVVFEITP